MAQVTLNLPNLPKDWHSTAVGLLGAIGMLVQEYTKTGTVTWEQIAIAVFVAVVCYFIPAKQTTADEKRMVETVTGIVNGALGEKLPTMLTQVQKVSPLVETGIEAVTQIAASQEPAAPGASVAGS